MTKNTKIAVNCEFGTHIEMYEAEDRIKEVVPRAAYYGFQKGHTVVLTPVSKSNTDKIPAGYKYCYMKIDDNLYSVTYTNVDPRKTQVSDIDEVLNKSDENALFAVAVNDLFIPDLGEQLSMF